MVYAPDSFPDIFAAIEPDVSTRDDVKAKLGSCEYGCESPTHLSSLQVTYYVCRYDLKGERVFPVVIFYLVEETREVVWKMFATVADN